MNCKKFINIFLIFLLLPFLVEGQKKVGKIYDNVDVEAEFIGGTAELIKWVMNMKKSIILDKKSLAPHRIAYKLTIEKTGKVSNVESIGRTPNPNDFRYMNACYNMPNWKPAVKNGHKVRSEISIVMGCSGVVED